MNTPIHSEFRYNFHILNVPSILHNFSLDIDIQNEDIIFIQSHLVPQNVKYRTKKIV